MLELIIRIGLGIILIAAAVSKLRRPAEATAAMATFGFRRPSGRRLAFAFTVAAELGLAAGVIAGSDSAAYLAAALMGLFALTLIGALLQGQAGRPCACFGPGSTVGPLPVLRNAALAAAFAVTPTVPETVSSDGWLAIGLGVALLACAALAIAVLALAREVGMLRLRLGPELALEIAHEGPELGGRVELGERFEWGPRVELGLAVFSSDGCHVCRALIPAIDSLRTEPSLSVMVLSEEAEGEVWESLAIPGAPYALVLEDDGTVGAKGTFNNLAQLEGLLGTAERRRSERGRVEALGV